MIPNISLGPPHVQVPPPVHTQVCLTHTHTHLYSTCTNLKMEKERKRSKIPWCPRSADRLAASSRSGSRPLSTLALGEPSHCVTVLTTKLLHYGEARASNAEKAPQRGGCTASAAAADVRRKEPLRCSSLSHCLTENASESLCSAEPGCLRALRGGSKPCVWG